MIKPKFRQIKLLLKNGRWITNKYPITSQKELDRFLKSKDYLKAYWTNSKWLNPCSLTTNKQIKEGYVTADHCFLGSDLLFDFDRDEYGWEQVRLDIIKTIEFMEQEHNFKLERIQFSGKNGMHVIYIQLESYKEQHPEKRRLLYQKQRQKLINRIPQDIKTLDRNISIYEPRIYKIPDSIDHSTGNKIQEISKEDLYSLTISEILARIPEESDEAEQPPDDRICHPQELERKGRPRISPPFKFKWISNKVYGIKDRYVPYIITDCDIRKIQNIYSLGTLYRFINYKNQQVYIGLKTISKRRLEKVLKASNSKNLNELMRKGFNKIITSEILIMSGPFIKEKLPAPRLISKIESKADGQYSKPHIDYISQFDDIQMDNTIGVSFEKIYESVVMK